MNDFGEDRFGWTAEDLKQSLADEKVPSGDGPGFATESRSTSPELSDARQYIESIPHEKEE